MVALAATGCGTWVDEPSPDSEPDELATSAVIPPVQERYCASIHAVLIARAERLGDCTAAPIGATPLSALGEGCAGLTADTCAQEHYDHPELYTKNAGHGSFDLHYLPASNTLKCADGTKPHYYYSPGSDSTKWIIYQNGSSGKCGRGKDRLGNFYEPGQGCYDLFDTTMGDPKDGDGNTGFARKLWWEGSGILDGNPVNVDFYTWNRVWVPSCSNDQYQGSADHPTELVYDGGSRDWYAPLYSHGFDIVTSVIEDLASGARATNLADAELVMLYGSSGGAGGLLMTLDAKAEHVRTVSAARVVGLLDSRAEPNLSGAEGLFDVAPCGSIFAADCPTGYSSPPNGTDVGANNLVFDATAYQPYDPVTCPGCASARTKPEWWGNLLDESCVAAHPINSSACYDGYHVLYNHTATPVFHATSLRDHNQYNNGIEYASVAMGDEYSFASIENYPDCGPLPRERVIAQLDSYWHNRDNVGGGAHGDSHDAGPIGIWAIDWADHEITKESGIFNDAALGGVTLSAAVYDWAVNEAEVFLIDAPEYGLSRVGPSSNERVNRCIGSPPP